LADFKKMDRPGFEFPNHKIIYDFPEPHPKWMQKHLPWVRYNRI